MNEIAQSFSRVFESNPIHFRRLFQEEPGIEGCTMFHRRPDQPLHMLANITRVLVKIVTAPLLQWSPHAITESVIDLFHWKLEYADTPAAVLSATKGMARAQYSPTGYKPSWVLEVVVKDGKLVSREQVPFSKAIKATGYTAIS
ncbi:hypothetical protein C8J57DRAFT_1069951, partial [Mycena rebaudengoi]